MFERFNEKARRVVFFARYEASQYGSSYIETEHLLLGLWREDFNIRTVLKDISADSEDSEIRREIERQIVRDDRFPTTVEVPLSAESKTVLLFAAEEAERLGQRYVGTEHVLLGLLRVKNSLGARVARARGVEAEDLRKRLAIGPPVASVVVRQKKTSLSHLEEFLTGLKSQSADFLMSYFSPDAHVVDVYGKPWNCGEIARNFRDLFAAYAKKNATYVVEETTVDSDEQVVTNVLWKNALVASMERVWMHRMMVVMRAVPVPGGDQEWEIATIQVTPVQP